MPKLRFSFVALLTCLALTAVAARPARVLAQPPQGMAGGGGQGRGQMMQMLFEGIDLSDTQRKSIDSIRTSYQPQMESLRAQGSSARPQMRDLMQKQTADIRSLLTPDQQKTFDKNRDAMRARMQQMGGMRGGGNS
jgi:Spy/CpxP family protein refolding chaperone